MIIITCKFTQDNCISYKENCYQCRSCKVYRLFTSLTKPLDRASDISHGRGATKFRYIREIP